jgi:hypothetical protein
MGFALSTTWSYEHGRKMKTFIKYSKATLMMYGLWTLSVLATGAIVGGTDYHFMIIIGLPLSGVFGFVTTDFIK